ncbi:MAG: TlpA family protein disulfide reductase [Planctomycetota bacterium]
MGLSVDDILNQARSAVAQFDRNPGGEDPTVGWCRKLRAYAKHIGKPEAAASARFAALRLAFERGLVTEAVAYFREAASNHPEHEELERWMKAIVDGALGSSPQTVNDLRDAISQLQRSKSRSIAAASWYYLGDLQAESGDPEGARRSFQKLGSSFSSSPYAGLATEALTALTNLREGRPAPSVQLNDLSGTAIDLAAERDHRPVAVYFWDPQDIDQQFMETLRHLGRELGDQVAFVGVATSGTKQSLEQFFVDMALPGRTADPTQAQAAESAYAVRRTPHIALIDRAGKIKTCGAPQSIDFESALLRLCGLLGPELAGVDKMIADYDTSLQAFNRGGRQGRHPSEDALPRFQAELNKPTTSAADRDKLVNGAFSAMIDADRYAEFLQFYNGALQQTKDAPVLGKFAAAFRDASELQGSSDWQGQLQDIATNSQNPAVAVAAKLVLAQWNMEQSKSEDAQKMLDEIKTTYANTPEAQLADVYLAELKTLAIGMPAPEFTATTLDGATLKLADLKGNVVVLCFGSAAASSGIKAADRLKALAQSLSNQSARFVSVWMDRDGSAAKRLGLAWPQVLNTPTADVAKVYNVAMPPRVFVVDQQGIIRAKGNPVTMDVEKTLKTLLQTAQK